MTPRRGHLATRGATTTLAALLASCAAPPSPEPPPLLRPTVSIRFQKPPRFADLVEATITISNTTLDPLLIETLELDGQLPCFFRRSVSLPGAPRERRASGEHVYDPEAPGATPPVFTGDWLLLPGESREATEWYRARFLRQGARILFRRIPIEDLCREAYFPEADPHRSRGLRFRHIPQSRLGEFRRGEPGTLDRMVILPAGEWWPTEAAEKTLEILFSELPDLEASPGAPAGAAITRWLSQRSWIVDDPRASRTFGIDEEGRRFELPRCDLKVFDVLDLARDGGTVPMYREGADEPVEWFPASGAAAVLERARAGGDRLLAAWRENDLGRFDYGLLLEPPPGRPDGGR